MSTDNYKLRPRPLPKPSFPRRAFFPTSLLIWTDTLGRGPLTPLVLRRFFDLQPGAPTSRFHLETSFQDMDAQPSSSRLPIYEELSGPNLSEGGLDSNGTARSLTAGIAKLKDGNLSSNRIYALPKTQNQEIRASPCQLPRTRSLPSTV